ncbi:TBC domain-containing protein kinase-like protein [Watersipora subatra]|uniref:TBC domain-containing protein kinase-like protein n=1 Tax=Watersipora subatra TaxID=2589382 RepID=UPI00355BE5BE
MGPLADGHLEATTFFASSHDNDQCGSNGLPLTPNSIRIIGRFQLLTVIEHPNLCSYIDLTRAKREQIIVVSEGHSDKLSLHISHSFPDRDKVHRLAYEILSGLDYLHSRKIVHRNLSLENVQLNTQGSVKLSGYGLYYMTENGASVPFPIGSPVYTAPEVFLHDCQLLAVEGVAKRRTLSSSDATELLNPPSAPNVDSWSLGIVLLQCIAGELLWADVPVSDVISSLLQLFLDNTRCAFDVLVHTFSEVAQKNFKALDAGLLELVKFCLVVDPSSRMRAGELLSLSYFTVKPELIGCIIPQYKPLKFSCDLRCADLTLQQIKDFAEEDIGDDYVHLKERSFQEIYCLWKLTGGDLVVVLKKAGLITNTPPIISMANFVSDEGDAYGATQDHTTMYNDSSVTLDLTQLSERLAEVDPEAFYPLIISEDAPSLQRSVTDTAKLPLVIRERDVDYQFHRIVLFDSLLKGYPFTKAKVLREARTDIPPLFRAASWAAILDVRGNIYAQYDSIDKVSAQTIDRQIEVDIPRCHQYNELMSSPDAHKKLKRVLKAWVTSHPQYVYWQGLDSLSAPFIFLNFNDEALAYACLSKFISKYLYNFFLKDNSAVIQEYLAMFSQLIAFHEPELSNHLEETGFSPDLYAIPWFLTMYAHVFPLHRLFHLWDTLLLGASVFPLYIGVAILQQLKSRLLTYGFNECILLFSDLPEINIEQCVTDSKKIFCSTPKSATVRVHAPPFPNKQEAVDNRTAQEKTLMAEALPLSELKSCRTLKISAEEMLSLLTPSSDWKQSKPKLVIIDIRSTEEYLKGTIPDAIHVPVTAGLLAEDSLLTSAAKEFLDEYRYQVKVVVDTSNGQSPQFASRLVSLGYTKVCYLHKGMTILRGSNLLVVPSPNV